MEIQGLNSKISENRLFSNDKFKLLFILIIIMCLFATQSVMAADNDAVQNLTLDDNSDSISLDSSSDISTDNNDGSLATANDEILSAGEYSLYNLYASVYWTDEGKELNLLHDYKYNPSTDDDWCPVGVYVFKSITINGNGHYIDGAGASNLMYIYGNDVVLRNITFINGNAPYDAPIQIYSDNVKFIDCNFINNTGHYAGAIDWYQVQNGALTNCRFENNTADSSGGAVSIESSKVNINKCDFINNTAKNGGAVYIDSKSTDQVISASTFSRNRAANYGGAVYVGGKGWTIKNTAFTYNSAYGGGAIYWGGNNGSLTNSWDIYENEATSGGAVYWNGENGNIYDSRIHHNHATYGGGLYLNAANNIVWSHFDANDADNGGGIYVSYYADGTEIASTNFGQNWARGVGGAIYWVAPNGKVDKSTFYNNGVQGNYVKTSGGAIYWIGDHAVIKDSKFIMNNAYSYGESAEGGALTFVNNYATVENTLFEENSASTSAGAIKWNGNYLTVDNSTFNKNHVSVDGGAIDGSGNNFVINQSTFTENQALAYMGGALSLDASGIIDNSKFIENFAYKGGAIHWLYGNYIVNNSYFYKNQAVYGGGAIATDYYYYPAEKSIQNSVFEENFCVNYGGAVVALDTDIIGSTFKNNSANMGSAIYSYSSDISDVTLENNDAIVKTTELIEINYPDDIIGNSTRKTNTSYIAMCVERNTMFPHLGIKDDSLIGLVNVKTGESIADYLKILVYTYFNSTDDVYPHEGDHILFYPEGYREYSNRWDYAVEIPRPDYYSRAVHEFSDRDFWNSDHPVVKKVLELYQTVYANGTKMPDKFVKKVDGYLVEYDFSSMISSTSQSLFLFDMIKHELTSVNVAKVWNDADNQDGVRPENVTVELFNGTDVIDQFVLNASNDWKHTFSDLLVYNGDKLINYTIREVNVEGYDSDVTNNTAYDWTVVNTHVPEVTAVNVTKVWNDADNQDGIRPSSITVELFNGTDVVATATLDASNNWTASFENLPVYSNGNLIVYSVEELDVADYSSVVSDEDAYTFVVTNTHVPLVTVVDVTKVWNDADNQDGVRPADVTVILLGNDDVVATATLDASNNWTASFENLPVYSNGNLIVYSVEELDVADYSSVVSDEDAYTFVVTNTHVPLVTVVNVTKVWNDNDNQDGVRPDGVNVVLVADGNAVATVLLDASNDWKYTFTDLPVYSNGKLIKYSVEELDVAGYVSAISNDTAYGWNVVNTHNPAVTSVDVTKVWSDNDNQDGVRPASVTVVLSNGTDVVGTAILDASNNWFASFENLPVYSNGNLIVYSVEELDVANYASVVSNDDVYSFIINNVHFPEVTSVDVTKVWNDNDNQDGIRPDGVNVVLVADGNAVATVLLDASNDWKYTFSDLPVYDNGKLIKYSVEELEVADYTSAISNDTAYDWTVVNTHVPLITVVNITKVWREDISIDEKPLEAIDHEEVIQVANETLYPGKDLKFTDDDEPVNSEIKEINYTIGVVEGNHTENLTEGEGNFTVLEEQDYPEDNITDETEDSDIPDEVTDEDVPEEPEVPAHEPSVPHKHVSKHVKPDTYATGNPILLLLLALFIPLIRRKEN